MIEERAPAKVNLVLHVGRRQADGLHEVCSLFASIDLADRVTVRPAPGGKVDRVICPGVEGPNLAEAALARFRSATGADLPPLVVTIEKRIPVAAGLGGGSADAAAALRAVNALVGGPYGPKGLSELAAPLGSDVPSQIEPAHALVTGTGERVERLRLPAMTLVLVPQREGLATGAVFAEADRIGSIRERLDPAALRALAGGTVAEIAGRVENDLEPAALSLRPELARVLEHLRQAGALAARITGSGPTAFGVFADRRAAEDAAGRIGGALVTALREEAAGG